MKQKLCFVSCILMMLLLVGCGSSGAKNDSSAPAEAVIHETSIVSVINDSVVDVPEYPVSSGMSSFSFTTQTNSYETEQGNTLVLEQIDRAVFISGSAETNLWVNQLLMEQYSAAVHQSSELYEYALVDYSRKGPEKFYAYSHYLTMGVGRHDQKIASILSLSTVNSGAATPSLVQTAYNLDLKNHKLLSISDVILPEKTEILREIVVEKVEEYFDSFGGSTLGNDYLQIVRQGFSDGSMTPYWYFNAEGLVFFYNPFELVPSASGIIKIQLQYDEISDLINPEYIPENKANSLTTKIEPLYEPKENTLILTADFLEGESHYFAVSNPIYGVQVSEVYFIGDTPVGQRMVFSADYIDDTVTLEVIFDTTNTERTYAITFNDFSGKSMNVYIRSDGANLQYEIVK